MRLSHTQQCSTCPWKLGSTVSDIPNYEESRHRGLDSTIADSLDWSDRTTNMSCHYAKDGEPRYCIGWLSHQLGPGNNIGLRLQMLNCENIGDLVLDGPQVDSFDDTFK